ncbi:hypothetical protein ABS71_14895 [bacterium SCN 62-11]|nr:hypothetical protein [Candidatus Eremiobacteraeota bacterium]ODT63006.1 MAG: hypothetical protein ABS71_14895 [bacterium SCN 62-11]
MPEQEFRELARQLPDQQWKTSQYLELIRHLDESDEEELLDYLEQRRLQLLQSLDSYRKNPIMPQEVTAETVAGHRLLEEGIEGWLDGVELLLEAVSHDGDCEPALDRIEDSNRLLIAVQRLHQRVAAQTASPRRANS